MTTFVALGDSITLGIGDPVRLAPEPAERPGRGKGKRGWRGWAALLADGLIEPDLHIVAGNGALWADVERDQLPAALQLRPDIASVVIGVNDTLRPNFDTDRIAASAAHTIGALRATGAQVLTMRLPDPGRMLGMPTVIARPLARRAHELNLVMDEVAHRFGTLHFDAARDDEAYDPRMWAVDRLHPSERGHRLIARRFHALLAETEIPVADAPGAEPTNQPPTKLEQFAWMATKGTAWVARRSTDLVPNLLAMAYTEWRSGQPPEVTAAAESECDLADAV
ncbi:MAG TPA: SGNH/GDSL hydrolase family protein [Streptosporangiaceae bacterium]|nr:SGNH/GDSL hydrolase family protein [Streptosporangiaceae bacterium]